MRRRILISALTALIGVSLSAAFVSNAALASAPKHKAKKHHVKAKSAAPKVNLNSKLMTLSQMPVGWSVTSTHKTGGIGCLHQVLEPNGVVQEGRATVSFDKGGTLPFVEEELASEKGSAAAAFSKIEHALSACHSVSGSNNGKPVTGTISQLSFPSYGTGSAAYTVKLTLTSVTAHEDVLIARVGNVIAGTAEATLSSVTITQFEGFVAIALNDITPGTVSTSTTQP